MNRILTLLVCGSVVVAAVFAWLWIDRSFVLRRDRMAGAAAAEAAHPPAPLNPDLDDAAPERHRRFAEELEKALGGPVDSVTRDPSLGIGEMLKKLTLRILPAGSTVVVQVDRFTDFVVLAELPNVATYDEMAVWVQELLRRESRYVHLVRFVHEGLVIGELDRAKIEALGDWSQVELAKVSDAIRKTTDIELGVGESTAKVVDIAPVLPDDFEEIHPNVDDSPLSQGHRQFREVFRGRVNQFHQLLRECGKSVNLGLLTTHTASNSRLDQIDSARREFGGLQGFFRDPTREMDRVFQAAKVDDVLRAATIRGEAEDYGARIEAERLFDAVRRYLDALRDFIRTMDAKRDLWTVQSSGVETVQFLDPSADLLYQKAIRECERTRETVDQSWADWSQAAWRSSRPSPSGDKPKTKKP